MLVREDHHSQSSKSIHQKLMQVAIAAGRPEIIQEQRPCKFDDDGGVIKLNHPVAERWG